MQSDSDLAGEERDETEEIEGVRLLASDENNGDRFEFDHKDPSPANGGLFDAFFLFDFPKLLPLKGEKLILHPSLSSSPRFPLRDFFS